MSKILSMAILVWIGLLVGASSGAEVTVFGPKQYLRSKGRPDVYNDAFSAAGAPGRLIVRNGDQSGQNRVSSAAISVNGVQVFGPANFSQQTYSLEAPVSLSATNSLSMELSSKPGSFLMIQVVQEVDAPTVTLSAAPSTILLGDSSTLSWTSNNATSAAIDQGIGPITLSGSLRVFPTATTTYTITVSGPGGTASQSVTIMVESQPQWCGAWWGDYEIRIEEPRDGTIMSRQDGPRIFVRGSLDLQVLFSSLPGADLTVNGVPATLGEWDNSYWAEISLVFGNNEVQVEAFYVEEVCWEENGEPVCQWEGRRGWSKVCVFYQPAASLDILITDPADGSTVRSPTFEVQGIVSSPGATVTVNAIPATVFGDGRFVAYVGLSLGTNIVTATASLGTHTVSHSISVTYQPLVRIIAPANGSIIYSSAITVSGIVADSHASVRVNGISAAVAGDAFTARGITLVPGLNTLTATASGLAGVGTDAVVVTYEVPSRPMVFITSPITGTEVFRPDVMVQGVVYHAPGRETGVTVNGMPALFCGEQFVANHVRLQDGENTITVTAADKEGNTASGSVTVTAETSRCYVNINADVLSGVSSFETTLRMETALGPQEPVLTSTGPGPVTFLSWAGPRECRVRLSAVGLYLFTATVADTLNNSFSDTVAILVGDKTELEAVLRAQWTSLIEALRRGDVTSAVQHFASPQQTSYETLFSQFAGDNALHELIQIMESPLEVEEIMGNRAVFRLTLMSNHGPYHSDVIFVRGQGVWRVWDF